MTTTDVVDDILEEIIFHCVSGDYSPPDFGTIIVEIISEIVMRPGNSVCQKSWKESEVETFQTCFVPSKSRHSSTNTWQLSRLKG